MTVTTPRRLVAPVGPPRYWHGGAPGLKPGELITPRQHGDDAHLVDGCPTCEARKQGAPPPDDDLDPNRVYVTTDRDYARIYAAGYPCGALYTVDLVGELPDPSDDPVPSWAVEAARVRAVYDPLVTLDMKEVRRLMRRYGLTERRQR